MTTINRVKDICDRIIELLPDTNEIRISLHGDLLIHKNYSVFVKTTKNIEADIIADVLYDFKTKAITVHKIHKTEYSNDNSIEIASLGFELLYCHVDVLLDYGVTIKKRRDTYCLDVAVLEHKICYVDEFEEE